MAQQQPNLVMRLFGGGQKRPVRSRRPRAMPVEDEQKAKQHFKAVAANAAYKELAKAGELATIGRTILLGYAEDARPLEEQIFAEEVRKDPGLRKEMIRLLIEKRRSDLGIVQNGHRENGDQDGDEGVPYGPAEGAFDFGAFAQEFVIGMMRDKLNSDPAPVQQNGIMGVLAALAQPGGVADKLLGVAMVNGGMVPHPPAAPPRPPYRADPPSSPALAAPPLPQSVDFVEPEDPGAALPPPVAAEPHALQPDDLAGVVDLDPEAAAHEVHRVFVTWISGQNPIMQAAFQGVLNSLLYMELDDALPMLKQYPIPESWAKLLVVLEQRRPWADELWRHLAGIWDQITEAAAEGEDEGNAD